MLFNIVSYKWALIVDQVKKISVENVFNIILYYFESGFGVVFISS